MIQRHTHDGIDLKPEERTKMFLECFRKAIVNGFYADVFGSMDDSNIVHLCSNYIVHHTENLTIMDPHFLECLYGDRAMEKAHWLTELRMRRTDIVPALYRDLFTKTKVPIGEEKASVEIGSGEILAALDTMAKDIYDVLGSICSTCKRRECICKKQENLK